jgi:uncharacterized cupin superfamily protein
VLRAHECAGFPKGSGNGHHLINQSACAAVYLEVGSRNALDPITCSDVDMQKLQLGRPIRAQGRPHPG